MGRSYGEGDIFCELPKLDFSHFRGAQKSANSDHEAFSPTQERCPWECYLST